jgi:hypothetical protein
MSAMAARIYELVKKGRSKRRGREAWHVHQRAFTSLVDVEAFLHNFRGVGRFAIAEFDREPTTIPTAISPLSGSSSSTRTTACLSRRSARSSTSWGADRGY